MNLKDEHIGLWIYDENRWTVTFHIQHHSDSGGNYKQQNMQGLGQFFLYKIDFLILIDANFYEPI